MQLYSQCSCHVVITGTRELQSGWGRGHISCICVLADHHEGLNSLGHLRVSQTVVAMPALRVQPYQPVPVESLQHPLSVYQALLEVRP
ncbi:hypothetical protein PSCFBP3800_05683 [Pseudomonas syringae group genomosp. 3]|nr:hypothetical protein PSCFBP3800_05683 [Pseudomonas syringae group genomosp. 3]